MLKKNSENKKEIKKENTNEMNESFSCLLTTISSLKIHKTVFHWPVT